VDIVDAQLHMGQGGIVATLEAMNSIGIQSVMLDEFWYWSKATNPVQTQPGIELPNGAWRCLYPTAEIASLLHPDRFSFLVRIARDDPQLASVMQVVASSPHARAFRFLATRTSAEAEAFIAGGYDAAFELAQDNGLPVCLYIPGYVEHLPRYLKKFPKVQFVVDHWGLGVAHNNQGLSEAQVRRTSSPAYLVEVLKLAEHPNVAIKLSHAHMLFGVSEYPYEAIRPHLRRAIEAFGADRLIWASDKTVTRPAISWSDLVHYLRDDPELTQHEKQQILGRNARRIFNWPAPTA
jgi:predicted TIM-barrel fold metal-dependent hydrolase